jgi:hypothetical protein
MSYPQNTNPAVPVLPGRVARVWSGLTSEDARILAARSAPAYLAARVEQTERRDLRMMLAREAMIERTYRLHGRSTPPAIMATIDHAATVTPTLRNCRQMMEALHGERLA